MTELLPDPEDPGKHLFEISPGRPARFQHCAVAGSGGPVGVSPHLWPEITQVGLHAFQHCAAAGPGGPVAVSLHLWPVKVQVFLHNASPYRNTNTSPSTTQKLGPNLEDVAYLGGN